MFEFWRDDEIRQKIQNFYEKSLTKCGCYGKFNIAFRVGKLFFDEIKKRRETPLHSEQKR